MKENLSQCSNWRGITQLNTVNEVFFSLLYDRQNSVLDPLLRQEQAEYRPGMHGPHQHAKDPMAVFDSLDLYRDQWPGVKQICILSPSCSYSGQ